MIIDLSKWNEYIADDVPLGPIPYGIGLEIMQIVTGESQREKLTDGFPAGLQADSKSIKVRMFWRIKVAH